MDIQQIANDFDNGVLLSRATIAKLINAALGDSKRLDWLQDNHSLHHSVEFLYTVGAWRHDPRSD